MPNLTQNSSLVNQISQIFTSTSLTPNSNMQLENKTSQGFNKIYKNELANGAKKVSEGNKLPQKTAAPEVNGDKAIKAAKPEAPKDESRTTTNDEEEFDTNDHLALADTSALLGLVDQLVAMNNQATAQQDEKPIKLDDNATEISPLKAGPATKSNVEIGTNLLASNQAALTELGNSDKDSRVDLPKVDMNHFDAELNPTAETIAAPDNSRSDNLQELNDRSNQNRTQMISSQVVQASTLTKVDSPALPTTLPQTLEITNKNSKESIKSPPIPKDSGKATVSFDETLIDTHHNPLQESDALHANPTTKTEYVSETKTELISKELANRFIENKTNNAEFLQKSSPTNSPALAPVQSPSGLSTISSIAATQMQDYISPRVGSKGWDVAIGQKMIWMVAGEESSVQLSLNPPDLGPLQVVLSVSDNQIDASFVSAHLDVREAIEAASPKLKEMMENAGISLTGFSVSAQAQSSENAFAQAQQQRSTHQANHVAKPEPTNTGTLNLNQTRSSASGGTGLVDTFV